MPRRGSPVLDPRPQLGLVGPGVARLPVDLPVGVGDVIGVEDAVFLRGEFAVSSLSQGEMDRILGSLYSYVEQCFRPALRIGFASRFPA